MQRVRLGSIDAVIAGPASSKTAVIMFHGYGADCTDLVALSSLKSDVRWVFPNGIEPAHAEPGIGGRAWFSLPKEALEGAFSGKPFDLADFKFPNLSQLHQRLDKMLQLLSLQFTNIVVGGFSQGSGIAIDWTLHRKEKPRGFVILSGGFFNTSLWGNLSALQGLEFFQSHGTEDSILSYASAQHLEKQLVEGGLVGELISFRGGHEIPPKVVTAMQKFLNSHLSQK